MSFGDSIRQTASMARWVSVAVTATDHIIFDPLAQDSRMRPLSFLRGPVAQAGLRALRSSCSRSSGVKRLAEVLGLEHLADLDLAVVGTGRA